MSNKTVFISGNEAYCQTYATALKNVDLTPVFDDKIFADGLLLSGGDDLSPSFYGEPTSFCRRVSITRDLYELYLVKKYLGENKGILGICRGLQVLNVYFGGSLIQDVSGHGQIDGKDSFHAIKIEKNSFLHSLYGEKSTVTSAHHQAVKRLGNGLKVSAYSDDNIIEAFETHNVLATQFHPERMHETGLKIFVAFSDILQKVRL